MITVLLCITWLVAGFLVGVIATYMFAIHEAKKRRRDAITKAAREKMREEKSKNDTSE